MGPSIAFLDKESTPMRRLHLQYGPIDLILAAQAHSSNYIDDAYDAAINRFDGLLERLVDELPLLRTAADKITKSPDGAVACRMVRAVNCHKSNGFVTPMAAVAGSVADEILAAMTDKTTLKRAYVNNGGDIALFLDRGQKFHTAIMGHDGSEMGRVSLTSKDKMSGIATSGQKGRSLSFGIADSVTVLARNAASADVAATLIANVVDLPNHSSITRVKANSIQEDTDLGDRLVVSHVGPLSKSDVHAALANGRAIADQMLSDHLIEGAALFLNDQYILLGQGFIRVQEQIKEAQYA